MAFLNLATFDNSWCQVARLLLSLAIYNIFQHQQSFLFSRPGLQHLYLGFEKLANHGIVLCGFWTSSQILSFWFVRLVNENLTELPFTHSLREVDFRGILELKKEVEKQGFQVTKVTLWDLCCLVKWDSLIARSLMCTHKKGNFNRFGDFVKPRRKFEQTLGIWANLWSPVLLVLRVLNRTGQKPAPVTWRLAKLVTSW